MGRACNTICRPPSMCSPLATTETATMRRVFVGLPRCSWASRRNYEITASSIFEHLLLGYGTKCIEDNKIQICLNIPRIYPECVYLETV